ncbi:MAG: class II aldolase/adducin family protein [Azoarcus sp.]|jgi:L-fuculose-phosphate aldolase|nr:class II aldolase/adducin family protein [Azoarcus sp.]
MNDAPSAPLATALRAVYREMAARGLNVGASGNVSVRCGDGFLITPSGLPPERCAAADMVALTMAGERVAADADADSLAPSSEWRIHRDIYENTPEAGAVIHAHSPFATALACQRRDIPPFHYMIARFGGDSVRCAAYATFGTAALSTNALAALVRRNACLLANHGMIACGRDLEHALAQAIELETLCEQYWRTCQMGSPVLLSADEMGEVLERFRTYGRPKEGASAATYCIW